MKKSTIKLIITLMATTIITVSGCGNPNTPVKEVLASNSQIATASDVVETSEVETSEEETTKAERVKAEAVKETTKAETTEAETTETKEETKETEKERTEPARIIFVGDSRTVQMYHSLYHTWKEGVTVIKYDVNGDFWSSKGAMGLKWMKDKGVPAIEDKISDNTAVVILMGVNDATETYLIDDYVNYINQKATEWKEKGADTYFVSINPVRRPNYGVTNELISNWNTILYDSFNEYVTYIDTFSDLIKSATYDDDVHYGYKTYLNIYDTIRKTVNGEKAVHAPIPYEEVYTETLPESNVETADVPINNEIETTSEVEMELSQTIEGPWDEIPKTTESVEETTGSVEETTESVEETTVYILPTVGPVNENM